LRYPVMCRSLPNLLSNLSAQWLFSRCWIYILCDADKSRLKNYHFSDFGLCGLCHCRDTLTSQVVVRRVATGQSRFSHFNEGVGYGSIVRFVFFTRAV
jgi:hypothetical protein